MVVGTVVCCLLTLGTFRSFAPAMAAANPDRGRFSSEVGDIANRPLGRGGAGGGGGVGGVGICACPEAG